VYNCFCSGSIVTTQHVVLPISVFSYTESIMIYLGFVMYFYLLDFHNVPIISANFLEYKAGSTP